MTTTDDSATATGWLAHPSPDAEATTAWIRDTVAAHETLIQALAWSSGLEPDDVRQVARIAAWDVRRLGAHPDDFPGELRRQVAREARSAALRGPEVRGHLGPENVAQIDAQREIEASDAVADYHRELVALVREPLEPLEDAVILVHYLLGRPGQTDGETAELLPEVAVGRYTVGYVGNVRRRALAKGREAVGLHPYTLPA